jgi:hypothetical protein
MGTQTQTVMGTFPETLDAVRNFTRLADAQLIFHCSAGITEWSKASYGPFFDAQGGGVFAMKWDETGIAVCEFERHQFPYC